MKIHFFKLSFVLFYLLTIIQIQKLNAQNNVVTESSESTTFLVIKNNGGEFIGEIISDDGREILMVTKSIGKIFIYKSDISSITPIDLNTTNYEMGTFKKESPFSTRYYFTNNALPIKQNENYALIHLFGPEIQLTVTPTTSLGIMCSWIASPIGIALKQQLYTKNNFHLSFGTIMGSSGYIEQGGILGGLHWLTMTIGDRVKNFSFSGGVGYVKWPSIGNSSIMGNQRIIGEKYSYDFYNQDHEYYVPQNPNDTTTNSNNYPYYYYSPYDERQNALQNELYENNYYSSYNSEKYLYRNNQVAGVFGISAIAPIGKKASFIFDSMIFTRNKSKLEYTSQLEVDIDYEVYNENTYQYDQYDQTIIVGSDPVISDQKILHTTFIFMPAIRFSKSYEKAFQIALAGYIDYHEINGFTSAPIPMVSWLRKF